MEQVYKTFQNLFTTSKCSSNSPGCKTPVDVRSIEKYHVMLLDQVNELTEYQQDVLEYFQALDEHSEHRVNFKLDLLLGLLDCREKRI